MKKQPLSKEELKQILNSCELLNVHFEDYELAGKVLDKNNEIDTVEDVENSNIKKDTLLMLYETIKSIVKSMPKGYENDPKYVAYHLKEEHMEILKCDKTEFILLGTFEMPYTEEQLQTLSDGMSIDIEVMRVILKR